MHYNANVTFHVRRFYMKETARYDQQFIRPYETRYDRTIEQIFHESLDTGVESISPTDMASAATSFLQPKSMVEDKVPIPEGFQEKRFYFMLEIVEANRAMANQTRYVLTGYTSHLGVSTLTGAASIDPRMDLYINDLVVIRDSTVQTPHGVQTYSNIVSGRQMLTNNHGDYYLNNVPQSFYGLRPEDVGAALEHSDAPVGSHLVDSGIYNGVTRISGLDPTSLSINSRPNYVTNAIGYYKAAQGSQNTYDAASPSSDLWSNFRAYSRAEPSSQNAFMVALYSNTNLMSRGAISYQELVNVLPDADAQCQVMLNNAMEQRGEYQPGQGEYWSGSSMEAIAAVIVQQTMPALMTDCLFVVVGFTASNEFIGGQHNVNIYNVNSFTEGLDQRQHLNYMIERIKREILQDISKNNQLPYRIQVDVDMLSETRVTVSINNQPEVFFVAPCFCSSLYSPMITADPSTTQMIAEDMKNMFGMIDDYTQSSASPQPAPYQGSLVAPGNASTWEGIATPNSASVPSANPAPNAEPIPGVAPAPTSKF